MKEGKEKSTWARVRGMFNTIHLWLGVGSGLILFVVCLSGTIYTFSSEIQKLTDSELHTVSVMEGQQRMPADSLIAKVLDSLNSGIVKSLVIPNNADETYHVSVAELQLQQGNKQASSSKPKAKTYFVDPYTGEILGTSETTTSAFFQFMFRLHRWLLLDTAIGRPIVGVATLIFVVIILTGLIIWFPKKLKNWRQGLKIKTSAKWKRVNHDLHSTLGIYASLLLLIMALTGLTWSFEWYKKGFRDAFGAASIATPKQFTSTFDATSRQASIERCLSAAGDALPYNGTCRLTLPSDSSGVVTVTKTSDSFFATSVADRVTIDQYSASVLNVERFADKPFNEKVLSSIKAIHIGSFYGTFSKFIYFFACLIGTSLPVTGVIIWINKLRKKNRKAARVSAETETPRRKKAAA